MEGLARLAELGALVYVGTFTVATAGMIQDRRTGTSEGPLTKVAGSLTVLLHILVPIPAMATLGFLADLLGIARVEGLAVFAFPLGFAGAVVCFVGSIYAAEAVESVTGVEPHERYA